MIGAAEASKHWKDAKRGGQWREQVLAAPTPGPQLVQQIDAHLRLIHETVQRDREFS